MKVIDLSHSIYNEMSAYPSDPDIIITKRKNIAQHYSDLHEFTMGTHTGTHLDTPAHIFSKGKTLSDFPLTSFMGRFIKVDRKNYKKIKELPENFSGVIYDTGWSQYFEDSKKYYGSHRPSIPRDLVDFCIKNRINKFGCDLPSVDVSGSKDKPVHKVLLKNEIIIYESLTNLQQLPSLKPFDFYGFPLALLKLDASPVRAVAVINHKTN